MSVEINATNFPDAAFRSYISTHFDLDEDGWLSDAEIEAATEISGSDATTIVSLEGVKKLDYLETINIAYGAIEQADMSGMDSLILVRFYQCLSLTAVDVVACSHLEGLYLLATSLSSLRAWNCPNMFRLYAARGQLTELDLIGNTGLKFLNVSDNVLTSLNLGSGTAYRIIEISGNKLQSFTLPACPNLHYLETYGNYLESVDTSQCTLLASLRGSTSPVLTSVTTRTTGSTTAYRWREENTNRESAADKNTDYLYLNKMPGAMWDADFIGVDKWVVTGGIFLIESPQDETVEAGESVTFHALYGGPARTYSWYLRMANASDFIKISGATNSYYTVTATGRLHGSQYKCNAINSQNASDQKNSQAATLTVLSAPVIMTQPQDITVEPDTSGHFSCVANAYELSYAWQDTTDGENWTDIANATETMLTVVGTEEASEKQYRCKVSNERGTVYSDAVTLTLGMGIPVITAQPQSLSVVEDNMASFSVTAEGDGLSYQWQFSFDGTSWTNVQSAQSASYSFVATFDKHEYRYRCIVSNVIGSVTSDNAELIVSKRITLPIITKDPVSMNAHENEEVSFTVEANGVGLTYQWQSYQNSQWMNISGATSSTYTVIADSGINGIKFRCAVLNEAGAIYSQEANLAVMSMPTITAQPQNRTVIEGSTTTFSISAEGNNLTYQWQAKDSTHDWTFMRNSNSPEYEVLATISLSGYQYRCCVWNDIGEIYSNPATLTVTADTSVEKPTIITQPTSVTVSDGSSATFAVSANGQDLSYQWQVFQNNSWTNIDGATLSVYMTPVTRGLNGSKYRCVVSNAAGAIYSDPATLTVTTGAYVTTPRVLSQPKSVNADLGELVTFWVRADGGDLNYQWQRMNDGAWYDITGATGSSYQVMARTEIHNTQYRCVVTNTAGAAYSNSATLSIRAGQELSFYGYHSIIISGKNTYGEWEMYPTSRPHIAPPEVKTNYVDLPGADGGLDYTDLLTGEPRFGYRKGSWEFLLIPQEKWASVYRSLVQYLHGRRHTVILEDDPNFVYSGRLSVNEWKSEPHNSLITIDYILEPFARDISGEQEDERTNEILDAANELLSKQENAGMIIAKVPGGAVLIDPSMLFENGDNIAY